jgi:hypothetical protein
LFVLVVVTGAVFVWAGSALADSGVGQTTPTPTGCASDLAVFQTGVSSGHSFTVPSGTWVLTSWSTQASSETGPMQALVGAPGNPNEYTVVGESATENLTANTLNTFSTSIVVHGGDVLGFWLGGLTSCDNVTGNGSDAYVDVSAASSPSVGNTATYSAFTGEIMNISATLVPLTNAAIRPPDHMFVCYSKYEQDGGALFTDGEGEAQIANGGWVPFALLGNVRGGDNIGAYHLECNPPSGSTATGTYVTDGGFVTDQDVSGSYAIET